MEVYHQDVVIRVPVTPGGQPFTLTLTGQGCADAGLCYPPMDSSVKLTPVAGGYALAGGGGASAAPAASGGGLSALVNAGDTGSPMPWAGWAGSRRPACSWCWACCWRSRPACCP